MFDADKKPFAEVVRASMDVYGRDVSPDVLRIWWAALQEFSIDEVRTGFSRYIKSTESGTFPPKPADIIRMIEGSSSDRGALAWAKVLEAAQRVGAYRSVCFDDPIIHNVIEAMGGWTAICAMEKDEQPFRSAEFAKRYRTYAETGGAREYPAYLLGIHEATNSLHGYKSQPPMLIGDQDKAGQVMSLGASGKRLQIRELPNSTGTFLQLGYTAEKK